MGLGFLILFTVLYFSTIKTVPGKMEYIVERLGRYHRTLYSGNNIMLPLIDRIVKKVHKNEMLIDFLPHFAVTKDKSEVKVSFVIYFQIIDSLKYTYATENSLLTMKELCVEELKSVIAGMELYEIGHSSDIVNEKLKRELNIKAEFLGIKVNRAELKETDVLYESAKLRLHKV